MPTRLPMLILGVAGSLLLAGCAADSALSRDPASVVARGDGLAEAAACRNVSDSGNLTASGRYSETPPARGQ
jgi:hypothetical protein